MNISQEDIVVTINGLPLDEAALQHTCTVARCALCYHKQNIITREFIKKLQEK